MGRKVQQANKISEKYAEKDPAQADPAEDKAEEEDPPIVKELKALDDKYLELEREYEREVQLLQQKYEDKQKPFLTQRTEILIGKDNAEPVCGTPALNRFWLQALQNHPAFEEHIEEWDEPVLEHLQDITKELLDNTDRNKGFKLLFHFSENPYFTNTELWKEYHTVESSPYTGETEVTLVDCSTIDWKAGKDVTVEKVQKKVKGGGAKKAKQKKEKDEPRRSFFRVFFRRLEKGMEIPDDLSMEDELDDDNEDEVLEFLMDNDYEIGCALRDQIVPFAVRWYTGEASPDDDDDDEGEEEEDDDDDDEESDDSEDEPAPKGKAGKKKGAKPAAMPKGEGGQDQNKECKQQ
mmetsp:Transcript_16076/g.35287  ORF Transcript_16076/g.35287 Transcript_16076/m.35287 type:complete len:350 (-) Transcript_16076:121-1170(-)|eukprot:CAMPEP_0170605972 /NCGR_PEP_ID=MMETSP0224-20130122/20256_1 /TAXON_ID=285029 /ORGANISM="Togula jolla, Strain CCCM 725" /LENGTH=349 /DNA_ID=CAMNT_0010931007 /DNA_START=56 /DNA_END=1105 /DNA_ORIENTATION=+